MSLRVVSLMQFASSWPRLIKSVHGHLVKLKSQKPLTTEHLSLSVMACSERKSLDRSKIMSAFVANISDLNTAVLFVKNVALK